MSAGSFVLVSYRANYDVSQYHPIRVQPETLALSITTDNGAEVNSALPDATTSPISAAVSGGARRLGLNARKVTIKFSGDPPTGYEPNSAISLPWLDPVTFFSVRKAQVGTYLNAEIVVVSTTPERVN